MTLIKQPSFFRAFFSILQLGKFGMVAVDVSYV